MTTSEPAHLAGHDDFHLTVEEARARVAAMTPAQMADVVDTIDLENEPDPLWSPLRKVALAGLQSHARRVDVGVLPARGGHVEAWLKQRRDEWVPFDVDDLWVRGGNAALDSALDDLRDRADIGAPWTGHLDPTAGHPEHQPENTCCGDSGLADYAAVPCPNPQCTAVPRRLAELQTESPRIATPVAELNALAPVHGIDDPDEGHTFFIAVHSQMASKVVGEPHQSDADWADDRPLMLAVRADNLSAALSLLAFAPLGAWARDGVVLGTDQPVPPRTPVIHGTEQ